MKKIFIASLISLCVCGNVAAQEYQNSRYYNPRSGRLDYSNRGGSNYRSWRYWGSNMNDSYFGIRLGPSFSRVSSDDERLKGGNTKTGLNIGFAYGTRLTSRNPLYFETGLYYVEKGGKGKVTVGTIDEEGNIYAESKKFTYNLDYLEAPVLLKYRYDINDHFRLEPFFGGYFAVGIAGKIKNYSDREAYSSFSSSNDASFQRCDAGLKFGAGVSYDMFYAELAYDWGLVNICHDDFDKSQNGALVLNLGVNF